MGLSQKERESARTMSIMGACSRRHIGAALFAPRGRGDSVPAREPLYGRMAVWEHRRSFINSFISTRAQCVCVFAFACACVCVCASLAPRCHPSRALLYTKKVHEIICWVPALCSLFNHPPAARVVLPVTTMVRAAAPDPRVPRAGRNQPAGASASYESDQRGPHEGGRQAGRDGAGEGCIRALLRRMCGLRARAARGRGNGTRGQTGGGRVLADTGWSMRTSPTAVASSLDPGAPSLQATSANDDANMPDAGALKEREAAQKVAQAKAQAQAQAQAQAAQKTQEGGREQARRAQEPAEETQAPAQEAQGEGAVEAGLDADAHGEGGGKRQRAEREGRGGGQHSDRRIVGGGGDMDDEVDAEDEEAWMLKQAAEVDTAPLDSALADDGSSTTPLYVISKNKGMHTKDDFMTEISKNCKFDVMLFVAQGRETCWRGFFEETRTNRVDSRIDRLQGARPCKDMKSIFRETSRYFGAPGSILNLRRLQRSTPSERRRIERSRTRIMTT